MGGGTEAFPDLGRHCEFSDCRQLDFLPFKCDACRHVFCVDHRSYISHACLKSDRHSRKVLVCDACSMSIETTGCGGEDEEKAILQRHQKLGHCDPAKKKKPTCPVRRCKEPLTFSNTTVCKGCQIPVCLKHRFPADHACKGRATSSPAPAPLRGATNNKFLVAFAARNEKDCGNKSRESTSSPTTIPSVKAF
ncbi:zinc finger AN1 domain-containing stress-associated protein 12 [Ipomoea triloba]|uniref:zinc finger AN1 domain-containing stress-associated protein 12 n=1 Tax=Ipomoea triloba TaxID=35885 RepID=UPI00125E26D6|nr:zinc finger AN1 domain-containing stress-associated protein 12 [Ipomoea triloba]